MHDKEPESFEQDGRTAELEAMLRRLPRPPVPKGLEAKLLAQIPAGGQRTDRRRVWPWLAAAGAAAAVILAAVILWPQRPGQPKAQPTGPPKAASPAEEELPSVEQLVQAIEREGRAARLLALADMLDRNPSGAEQAEWNRNYVLSAYGDTQVARAMRDSRIDIKKTPTTKENSNG